MRDKIDMDVWPWNNDTGFMDGRLLFHFAKQAGKLHMLARSEPFQEGWEVSLPITREILFCGDCGAPATVVTSADTLLCDDCQQVRHDDDPGDLSWMDHDTYVRLDREKAA